MSWLCKQLCKAVSDILIRGNVVELYTVTQNLLMNKMIVNIKVLDLLTFYRIFLLKNLVGGPGSCIQNCMGVPII